MEKGVEKLRGVREATRAPGYAGRSTWHAFGFAAKHRYPMVSEEHTSSLSAAAVINTTSLHHKW